LYLGSFKKSSKVAFTTELACELGKTLAIKYQDFLSTLVSKHFLVLVFLFQTTVSDSQ